MSAFMRLAQKLAQFPLTPLEAGIVQGYLTIGWATSLKSGLVSIPEGVQLGPPDVAYLDRLRVKYRIETGSF